MGTVSKLEGVGRVKVYLSHWNDNTNSMMSVREFYVDTTSIFYRLKILIIKHDAS